MPKEIFSPTQYSEVQKFLKGPMKLVKTLEASISHSTFLYWFPPTNENEAAVCDDCGARASFLLLDRDHRGFTSANLTCQTHAHRSFLEIKNSEK